MEEMDYQERQSQQMALPFLFTFDLLISSTNRK
jgi:hypothetical protein